jgi:mRNA interferase HicA
MKYSEFHRKIPALGRKKGWKWTGEAEGSHYVYKDRDGKRYPVPFHGAKEMPEGLRRRIIKEMEL